MIYYLFAINYFVDSIIFMSIIQKIREDWGTATHFCRKNGLNYDSFKVVVIGRQKSQACVDALIKHGYIGAEQELPQYKSDERGNEQC